MSPWRSMRLLVVVTSITASMALPLRASAADPTLRLVAQTTAIAADGNLVIDLDLDPAIAAGAAFRVSARPIPADRDGFRSGLLDASAPAEDEVVVDEDQMSRSGQTIRLTIPTESAGDTEGRLALADAGPYAVTVSVDGGVPPLTTVVVRGESSAPVVRVAFGVAVDSPLTLQPDGTSTIDPEVREEVVRLTDFLERAPVPITVMVRPELLAGLARSGVPGDAELVSRLGVAVARHTVLATTHLDLDPSAAAAASRGGLFTDQLRAGEDTVAGLLGIFPDRGVWMAADPLSSDGASLVRDLGANVIVRLAGVGVSLTKLPADVGVFEPEDSISRNRAPIPVVVPDPVSATLSVGSDDPVLTAARLAGELLATHGAAGDPGAVVVAELDTADASTLDALLGIVATGNGLVASRIEETTLPNTVDELPDDGTPMVVPDLSAAAATRDDLVGLVDSTTSMLTPGDTRGELWPELADAVLDARLTEAGRADYADGLRTTLLGIQQAVVIQPPATVNLGDRSSTVPITIRNDNPFPVVVEVRLVSDKLRFPPTSDAVTVPAEGTAPLRIPVDARTNGRFPVMVELVAPGTNERVGAPVTFSVRVGRLTGLGIVITFGAVLVLLTWWVQHLRRRHRRHRSAAATDRHPVAGRVGG